MPPGALVVLGFLRIPIETNFEANNNAGRFFFTIEIYSMGDLAGQKWGASARLTFASEKRRRLKKIFIILRTALLAAATLWSNCTKISPKAFPLSN